MTDKSHVSMEKHVCPVCITTFDTGNILLDTMIENRRGSEPRLRQSLDRYTVTGWSLCPEHKALFDKGYVALVEIDKAKSKGNHPAGVYRLGRIAHMRRAVFDKLFPGNQPDITLAWVDSELMNKIEEAAPLVEEEAKP